MTKRIMIVTICLTPAMYAGSAGIVQTTWAAQIKPGGTVTQGLKKQLPTHLTVGECTNLGCHTEEGSNCPPIMHDYGIRHWRCVCSSGSNCIDQNSPALTFDKLSPHGRSSCRNGSLGASGWRIRGGMNDKSVG
jgi:hypothetical protein